MKKILFVIIAGLISLAGFGQTRYYVKNGGNNALDGLTDATAWANIGKVDTAIIAGDSVFFKRGDTWRERFVAVGGTSTKYTYYGAYGTGAKPLFLGSDEKNELTDWTGSSTNVWKCTTSYTDDIGNIVFNNEASVGVKCMTATPLPDSLDVQGDFWMGHAGDTLILYSVGNPASVYTDIELVKSWEAIYPEITKHYITFQNLDWRYWGDFVREQGGNYVNFLNCDISYCGGVDINNDYVARFGGALQCYSYNGNGNHDVTISRCRISQCYDDGISLQGYSGLYETYNIFINYNIIIDCELPFNFYHRSTTGATTHHIYFENNTIVSAAGGWGHAQRSDVATGASLRIYLYTAAKSDIYIRNNILYESVNYLVEIANLSDLNNIILNNNLYYNTTGDIAFDYPSTYYTTLAAWQTATGQEANGVSGDPLFTGTGTPPLNYKLQSGSPAKDAGISVGLTSDYGGYNVPVGPLPDIGAWEYGADVTPPNWHPTGLGWDDIYFKNNFRDTVNFTVAPTIAGAPLNLAALLPSGLTATVNDLNATTGATGNFQGQINAIEASTVDDSKADTSLSNLASVAINTHLLPGTDGAVNLGSATYKWGNIFMDSAKVVNWNNGDITATHSDQTLTFAGGSIVLPSTTSIGTVDATEISHLNNTDSNIEAHFGEKVDTAGGVPIGDVAILLGDTLYSNNPAYYTQRQVDSMFTAYNATITAFIPPYVLSAEVGDSAARLLRVFMSESMVTDSIPDDETFMFTEGADEIDITSVLISNDTLFLVLATTPQKDSTLLIDYTKPTPTATNHTIEDSDINETKSWNNKVVTNHGYVPTISKIEFGEFADDTVLIVYNKYLDQDSVPPIAAFTFKEDGTTYGLGAAAAIGSDSLFIPLDSAGVYGSVYTLTYARDYPYVQDSAGYYTVNFTNTAVTNNFAAPAANMINNGTFDSATGWGLQSPVEITGGVLHYEASQEYLVAGQADGDMAESIAGSTAYTITFDLAITSGDTYITFINTAASVIYKAEALYTAGAKTVTFTTPSDVSGGGLTLRLWGTHFTIDNVIMTAD